jgi:sugar/nucleoside kinase (ribokinase family)
LAYERWPEKELILSHIDILKADAVEAEMMTGLSDLRAAAQAIAQWGPKEVVVTHRDGVLVLDGGSFHEAPFRPRQLVGRSGRGDTCIASYVARRLSAAPANATVWAAAVTSLKMEAEGPINRALQEVEELIRNTYRAPSTGNMRLAD